MCPDWPGADPACPLHRPGGDHAPQGRRRLAPASPKRKAEAEQRRQVVQYVTARDGARCAAAELVPDVKCWGPLDPDEVCPRSAYPGGHLDPENVQLLCRMHHDWKHAHPDQARQLGLRRDSWEAPR